MPSPNIIRKLLELRQRKKLAALWDQAKPVSLEELKAELAALACSQYEAPAEPGTATEEILTLDQLWALFESLDDIDDCQVIF